MAAAARKLYVNVPVQDLDRSVPSFTEVDIFRVWLDPAPSKVI
jgi:hypothetical protein